MPSARWMTCTTSHSPPLAEWMVDRVSQSSSSCGRPGQVAGRLGGSRVRSVSRTARVGVAARRRLQLRRGRRGGRRRCRSGADDGVEERPEPLDLRRRRGPSAAQSPSAARSSSTRPRRAAGTRAPPPAAEQRAPRAVGRGPDAERLREARRRGRPDAVEQVRAPGPRQLVPRVLEQPQQRQQVLHVGRLEEPQPAVLHERDVAARSSSSSRSAVVCRRGTAPPAGAARRPVAVRRARASHDRRRPGRPRRRRCAAAAGAHRRSRPHASTLPEACPGAAAAITALAAARIGGVERWLAARA